MLDREFRYYLDNQNEIVKSYNGKVVEIKDDSPERFHNNTK